MKITIRKARSLQNKGDIKGLARLANSVRNRFEKAEILSMMAAEIAYQRKNPRHAFTTLKLAFRLSTDNYQALCRRKIQERGIKDLLQKKEPLTQMYAEDNPPM